MAKATLGQIHYSNALSNVYDMARNTLAVDIEGNNYYNIAGADTTFVSNTAGVLHGITINTATAVDTITIYDNTNASGTKIGSIGGTVPASFLQYDVAFTTGLTIVTAGASDITVVYRPKGVNPNSPSSSASSSASSSPSSSASRSPSASPSTSPSSSPSSSASQSPSASPSLSPSASSST